MPKGTTINRATTRKQHFRMIENEIEQKANPGNNGDRERMLSKIDPPVIKTSDLVR